MKRIVFCKWCGNPVPTLHKLCPKPCRIEKKLLKSLRCFGFNTQLIGTEHVHKEVNRIAALINYEYYSNELSLVDLCKKYNYPDRGTLGAFLKRSLGIKLRNHSQSGRLCYKQGKTIPHTKNQFKSGTHITWCNKEVRYRSSYELEAYKMLDKENINYSVESIRIQYFDTQRQLQRTAIPDILIASTGILIEIKSSFTYNYRNTLDKFTAYEHQGYKPILLLEGKFMDLEKLNKEELKELQYSHKSNIIEAPEWLKEQMKKIAEMPPPSLEEVEQQFKASDEFRKRVYGK